MVIKCPKCNHYVSDTAVVCPHCGAVLKGGTPVQAQEPASFPQEDSLIKQEPAKEEMPVTEQKRTPVASPYSSAPVAPPPVAHRQTKNNRAIVASVIVALLFLCGIGGFWYFKNLSNAKELDKIENLYFESALGTCSYTGTVDGDKLPHGTGEATFTDGRFYRGSFVHGNFDGNNAYFLYDNGDVFEGTFADNKFSEGKYTIKSDGSYFEGSFENGQPSQGLWFDKNGKNLISQ